MFGTFSFYDGENMSKLENKLLKYNKIKIKFLISVISQKPYTETIFYS